ncbi:unnamed protein product, partial [Rotaria socialis]
MDAGKSTDESLESLSLLMNSSSSSTFVGKTGDEISSFDETFTSLFSFGCPLSPNSALR